MCFIPGFSSTLDAELAFSTVSIGKELDTGDSDIDVTLVSSSKYSLVHFFPLFV